MATALRTAYDAMPEPRLVAALGNCALGHNIIGARATHAGGLEAVLPVHIRIPGCPPTPAKIAEHLLATLTARNPTPQPASYATREQERRETTDRL